MHEEGPSKPVRVAVAMSGGVDSSVAAALLKQKGYQVIGITMQIWPSGQEAGEAERFGGCCGMGAIEDARRVARKLGFPHYVVNFREVFARSVIDPFCREYRQGRTPNPCVRCNRFIKFDALLHKVRGLGADFLATGHYARIEWDGQKGRHLLRKGIDKNKDQSYWLYALTQEQLGHTLMPLGELTKDRVRGIARGLGLPVADKPESQDICFIPEGKYAQFLAGYVPEAVRPGPVLDRQGRVLGEHRGIIHYTIGQRHGLGVAAGRPLYVTAIDPERNAVIVGDKTDVYGRELIAGELNWIVAVPEQSFTAKAKIRYLHPGAEARISSIGGGRVEVRFTQPQMAITPGQAVVFYDGDVVLGGAIIEKGTGS